MAQSLFRRGAAAAAILIAATSAARGQQPESRPVPEVSKGATERPVSADAAESRPQSRPKPTSPDVPEWSKDPLLDGMKAVVRDLVLKGFEEERKAELADRIRKILETGDVGDDARRARESDSLAATLLSIQQDYRPKGSTDPKRLLTQDEEQRVRLMAETLSRDLYRRLPKAAAPLDASGNPHTGLYRAAPVLNPPPGYRALDWKTLGGFEYTEGMKLPEEVRKLHGEKVAIAGYMFTLSEFENIREFMLVESLWSCCFGVPPTVNQVLVVKIDGRKGVEYTGMPVMLLGTLDVGEKIEDGWVTSLYRIRLQGPAAVKPIE
ncbi:MAG TPA: DUF3299 domain-containing protein [Planctomycetota bacterium]|nr:DUF3299 domain-containing protein [Planctomycetota bacterium]